HALGGFSPSIYHLTNILLHAANSLLVFLLLHRLSQDPSLALAASLIFALHPVHTEAVAWVSGRTELLACFFMLVAWWTALASEGKRLPWWRIGAAPFLYLLALLSKESALVFLPVLWCFRTAQARISSQRGSPFPWHRVIEPVDAGFLSAAVTMLLLRTAVLGQVGPKTADTVPFVENPLAYASLLTRVLTSVKLLGLYLWKMLWPVHLSSDYSFNQVEPATWADPLFWVSLALLALCLFWALRTRLASWMAAGVWASFLGLGMVIHLLFPTGTLFAERLAYFPLLGFSAAAAAALLHPRLSRLVPVRPAALVAAVLLAFFARSIVRNTDWKDSETLFLAMARTAPESAKAQTLAGLVLADRDPAAARRHFEKSLQIYPRYSQAELGLAQAEINSRNFLRAEQILTNLLQRDSQSKEAFQALLRAYRGSQKFDQALETAERFLSLRPGDPFALTERAIALQGLHRNPEAIDAFQKAIAAAADSAEIRNRLGTVYLEEENLEAAFDQFLLAARLEPADPVSYFNLASVYKQRGDKQGERQAYVEFLRRWKGDPRVAASIRSRLEALQ
ncbi:MAG: tetratricopeptide repeat protein, partial [Acidobacteria bacterium]|nr:tetratricopeptide repeat protein [Acidobacteriota bacterium]